VPPLPRVRFYSGLSVFHDGASLRALPSSGTLSSICQPRPFAIPPSPCTGWAFYFRRTGRMPAACGVHPGARRFRTCRSELGFVMRTCVVGQRCLCLCSCRPAASGYCLLSISRLLTVICC